MTLTALSDQPTAPTSYASAGIVDARTFSVGQSDTVHALTHYGPNVVRAACGLTANVVERPSRLARWRDAHPTCLLCNRR